ncbi:MAG: SnoaL-like domain-containing protein [Rhodospirillaceae bacterium]|mgnify:FL=1|jgi:ketosteroid isomerase-like protein|nr:SnoaL-like domain-containing protein [Rhodospirillaceae bacterium]MBT5242154.1 SnoaL-like domain-containing protein [Rhodospirillaceae bacterium]MBT5565881.1 SnoaL-like domain-containing protein [Rhodospirillaceae bacterium]MBT6088698.1 SnoaL-like domain-containing protein [Rhodospirillaceae bacterium]MBT6961865.1 SnoaL-like domain-containing protein [Rhodospirillaceae bacterium]
MGTPTEDIAATLAELCGCWNRLDQPAIRDLWDSEETEPYFLPQEIKEPIIGWDGLAAYYATAQARLVRCSMRTWDIHAKLLSPDLAVALYQMHWNGEIKGFDHLFGIDSRVTALFRKRDDRWLICHYVEAPAAPMLHLQKYYASNVDPDFLSD